MLESLGTDAMRSPIYIALPQGLISRPKFPRIDPVEIPV
jgi:hypothetical protein